MKYSDLLRDPRWQRKRLEVMQRANFACETCGDTMTTLNVHHIEYVRGRKPWDYPSAELRCLCEPCHGRTHGLVRERPADSLRRERDAAGRARREFTERELVRMLLHLPDRVAEVAEKVSDFDFVNPQMGTVFVALCVLSEEADADITALLDRWEKLRTQRGHAPRGDGRCAAHLLKDARGLQHADEVIASALAHIHRRRLEDRLAAINCAMPVATDAERDAMMQEKLQLVGESMKLGSNRWKAFR